MRYQEEDAVGESRTWAGASRVMEMQATPKREHARAIFSVPLTLRHSANEGFGAVRGISLDISQGGLGAMVQGNLQIGEAVQIDFALGKRKLTAAAIVRHTSNVRCGFEFLDLTDDERRQIMTLAGTA